MAYEEMRETLNHVQDDRLSSRGDVRWFRDRKDQYLYSSCQCSGVCFSKISFAHNGSFFSKYNTTQAPVENGDLSTRTNSPTFQGVRFSTEKDFKLFHTEYIVSNNAQIA